MRTGRGLARPVAGEIFSLGADDGVRFGQDRTFRSREVETELALAGPGGEGIYLQFLHLLKDQRTSLFERNGVGEVRAAAGRLQEENDQSGVGQRFLAGDHLPVILDKVIDLISNLVPAGPLPDPGKPGQPLINQPGHQVILPQFHLVPFFGRRLLVQEVLQQSSGPGRIAGQGHGLNQLGNRVPVVVAFDQFAVEVAGRPVVAVVKAHPGLPAKQVGHHRPVRASLAYPGVKIGPEATVIPLTARPPPPFPPELVHHPPGELLNLRVPGMGRKYIVDQASDRFPAGILPTGRLPIKTLQVVDRPGGQVSGRVTLQVGIKHPFLTGIRDQVVGDQAPDQVSDQFALLVKPAVNPDRLFEGRGGPAADRQARYLQGLRSVRIVRQLLRGGLPVAGRNQDPGQPDNRVETVRPVLIGQPDGQQVGLTGFG
ncbi:MAG: hypothetical protein BWY73_01446 [candidate division TA06 bacterium ADurb.Bin417]|uniref:Uncharacterized protein n=1 Tax=candidate division TA06 bacterium ADurb.Bin417 TaxID=1852828 RepID=A0A1V5M9E9_UNCT6|nr:MAG: hypothetical protein BWY73_01446 [candidate division TA06 bacterium ADurb.Bin417]